MITKQDKIENLKCNIRVTKRTVKGQEKKYPNVVKGIAIMEKELKRLEGRY